MIMTTTTGRTVMMMTRVVMTKGLFGNFFLARSDRPGGYPLGQLFDTCVPDIKRS